MRRKTFTYPMTNSLTQSLQGPGDSGIFSIPSLTVWREAKFYSTDMTDDGAGLISQWNDHETANGATADNMVATGANRPTYGATLLNGGYPALNFNTSNLMEAVDSVDYDFTTGRDVYLGVEFYTITGADQFLWRRYTVREMQFYLDSTGYIEVQASTTGASSDRLVRSAVQIVKNGKYLIHAYWDGAELGISVKRETPVTTAMTAMNAGASPTRIGSVSTFHTLGYIFLEGYSNKKLTAAEEAVIESHAYSRYWSPITLHGIGQSLIEYYGTRGGETAFADVGGRYYRPDNITFDNSAVASTPLLKAVADLAGGTDYWWNESTGEAGPLLIAAYAAASNPPDVVLWDGCQDDRSSGAVTSKAQIKNALSAMFADIHTTWPNAKILIQTIGTSKAINGASNNKDRNTQWVREAEQELVDELAYVYFCQETFDQATSDSVHPTSFITLGQRLARRVAEVGGLTVAGGTVGPTLVSAAGTGANTLTATINHDVGTDFTPTTGIAGFVVFSDGALNKVTAAARASATTINITCENSLGANNTLYHIYGMMSSDFVTASPSVAFDPANVLVDNSTNALPLQAGKVTIT